jgi:hypothetical protein
MKKKATKKPTSRGKSKLKDLAPKVDPKAGLNFAADGSVMPQVGNTNTGIGLLLPAVQDVYKKV